MFTCKPTPAGCDVYQGVVAIGSLAALEDDPDKRVAQVIGRMGALTRADSGTWPVQALLRGAAADPVTAAFWGTKRAIEYAPDEEIAQRFRWQPIAEVLIRPRLTALGGWQGDCDDFSMLVASALTGAGIPCRFVTVAADPSVPDQFSHVYVAAYLDGQRIALDASHGPSVGWEVSNRFGLRKEWSL